MNTLSDEVKAVQTSRGWSFQESWNFLESTRPELFVQSSAESNRIRAKQAPLKEKEAREKFAHVEAIAKRLMQRNSKLTFGKALEITRICLPGVQAEIKELLRQSVKAEEPKTYLVQSVETGRQIDFGEES